MRFGNIDGLLHGNDAVVYDSGEITASTQTITIEGLRGDIDETYEIITRLVRGGTTSSSYLLRPNGDVGTNYGRERLRANQTTLTGNLGTGHTYMSIGYAVNANDISGSDRAAGHDDGLPAS